MRGLMIVGYLPPEGIKESERHAPDQAKQSPIKRKAFGVPVSVPDKHIVLQLSI
jgi:hypothetical protein